MSESMPSSAHSCDIYRVARQGGVRLHDSADNRTTGRKAGDCFCKPTLRSIGRRHGEAHLALCLRLIVETGNGGELHAGTISAISIILQSGMVEIGASLFDRLDGIDLGRLRRACSALPGSTPQLMAAALLALLRGQEMARAAVVAKPQPVRGIVSPASAAA